MLFDYLFQIQLYVRLDYNGFPLKYKRISFSFLSPYYINPINLSSTYSFPKFLSSTNLFTFLSTLFRFLLFFFFFFFTFINFFLVFLISFFFFYHFFLFFLYFYLFIYILYNFYYILHILF